MTDHVYDIETYPNFFSLGIVNVDTGEYFMFECSDRCNNSDALKGYLHGLIHGGHRMVGYNNVHFDYPVLHHLMSHDVITAQVAFEMCEKIIATPWDDRFRHVVKSWEVLIPQVDLFKIHHFDNINRSTSLKMLECNMKSENVEDLPIPPGTTLTPDQMDTIIHYNGVDISETWRFYNASLERIKFRDELTERYDKDFTNHNDTKIGKDYFIMKLNEQLVDTHGPNRQPLQTRRSSINLRDAVMPSIKFEHPEFNRILNWFKTQTITETKGVFTDVNCTVNGFTFDFGLGGIHGSVTNRMFEADIDHTILDIDVESYYPNVAIKNRFYPEHLSEKFCDIYDDVFQQRKSYAKGTAENAMMKLALNGVYGDSNNTYSPFYDPLYTMKVTINGQLLLCMLAEKLMRIKGLEMIQINTDGLTVRVPRDMEKWVTAHCKEWEHDTQLHLESNEYSRMWVRDVNNYIAEYTDGKLKRKGAYGYGPDLDWNQNHSQQVIAKAVEAHLVRGESVRKFIETHGDMHDFFLNTKVPRSSHLILVDADGNETMQHHVTRYYISNEGGALVKCMPPLKGKTEWRRIGIKVGHTCWPCNHIKDATARINYEYYINEAEKLCLINKT